MDTVKINHGNTKMIAHRGLSGIEQENTNAAFVAAGNRSYYGIETDVHRTADGQYVIIHDDTTARVTNSAWDVNVEQVPYRDIQAILLPDQGWQLHPAGFADSAAGGVCPHLQAIRESVCPGAEKSLFTGRY